MTYRRTTGLSRPVVFAVTQFQQPIRIRAGCNETLPAHADLCRYDLAFHAPHEPSLIIFPWFRQGRDGLYPVKISVGRWKLYAMSLDPWAEGSAALDLTNDHPIGDWIGYQRQHGSNNSLEPVTLSVWLQAHPGVSLHGWRRVSLDSILIAN